MTKRRALLHRWGERLLSINPPFHLRSWKKIRFALLVGIDLTIVVLAFFLAFWLRLEEFWPRAYRPVMLKALPLLVVCNLVVFYFGGMYSQIWRYANLNSVLTIGKALGLGTGLFVLIFYILVALPIPRSIFILFTLVAFTMLTAVRFSWRVWTTWQLKISRRHKPRCLIYGAGSAGNLLSQHIVISSNFPFAAVGFIDDDKNKYKRSVHGLKVLGDIDRLAEICKREDVSTIIIAMHSAPGRVVRKIVDRCQEIGVKPLMMPDMSTSLGEDVFQPRPINIADLLKRAHKSIDRELVDDFLVGRIVLITGAGGSIGSELARQVLQAKPAHLILLDSSEYNLYEIENELRDTRKNDLCQITPILGSACERRVVETTIKKHRPSVILHAAAYKHVPLMESNPIEGIINNLTSTKILCECAVDSSVEKFLLISSDKAVRPTSIMGTSKRACELLLQAFQTLYPDKTMFCAVRFGNVLGSSGSVIPRFVKQIQLGGPVTVTHPDITRYFMLTTEAVGLVLQSVAMAKGGEIYILDMGQPVRIYDMAKQLVLLAGKTPGKDLEIVFTGLRAGEKLYEELIIEGAEQTTLHEDVYLSRPHPIESDHIFEKIEKILAMARAGDEAGTIGALRSFIHDENTKGTEKSLPGRSTELEKGSRELIH